MNRLTTIEKMKKQYVMIKKISGIILALLILNPVRPCTTFVLQDSTSLVFGRNYDYDLALGFLCVNKRGVAKQSLTAGPYPPARWVSRYGSITFNQVGIDAPMGGMNEEGLVIAQMALPETKYTLRGDKPALNQLEWIQYQLDNSATLDDVIENSQAVEVVPVATPVHYLVCDRLGQVGILEYLNGELVVYRDDEITIPVCSNMAYENAKDRLSDYQGFGGQKVVPRSWKNVADIIAIAGTRIAEYDGTMGLHPVAYSFDILETVGSPIRTQWSVVYDLKNQRIHFKTLKNRKVRTLAISDWDYSCDGDITVIRFRDAGEKQATISLTKEDYRDYKQYLINWFKNNVPGFPDIGDAMIQQETRAIFRRTCQSDALSRNTSTRRGR